MRAKGLSFRAPVRIALLATGWCSFWIGEVASDFAGIQPHAQNGQRGFFASVAIGCDQVERATGLAHTSREVLVVDGK